MKRYIWSVAAAALVAAFMQGTAAAQDNMLTEAEQEAGWKLLFDGQTLLGWTHRGGTAIWAVEDGMLTGEATGWPGIHRVLRRVHQFRTERAVQPGRRT